MKFTTKLIAKFGSEKSAPKDYSKAIWPIVKADALP